jgi:hypothetical protein
VKEQKPFAAMEKKCAIYEEDSGHTCFEPLRPAPLWR